MFNTMCTVNTDTCIHWMQPDRDTGTVSRQPTARAGSQQSWTSTCRTEDPEEEYASGVFVTGAHR
jgi:hypothetical protein